MKCHYAMLLLLLTIATPATSATRTTDDPVQDLDGQLNLLQQNITDFVTQSGINGIDPDAAQDIIDQTNDLNQYIQQNIQQDLQDIRVAAAISSLLETAKVMLPSMNVSDPVDVSNVLNQLSFPAHANTLHTLAMGAYPGALKDQPNYTNPYMESVGFIANYWLSNVLLSALLTQMAPTATGQALSLNPSSSTQQTVGQVLAGVVAHFAWLMQKKLYSSQQTQ